MEMSRRAFLFSNHPVSSWIQYKSSYCIAKKPRFLSSSSATFRLDPITGLVYHKQSKQKKIQKEKAQQQPLFQTIVGLEIHAQLDISTKLFSPACVVHKLGLPPNKATNDKDNSTTAFLHPYDVGVPGYLPVLSKEAVQAAVLAAGILQCQIAPTSRFERKHYTYADLPLHYQITQQRWPLATQGHVQASVIVDSKKQSSQELVSCRIHRLQLEQDTGKTFQSSSSSSFPANYKVACVDFNRAGQALIEIVLEPDLRTPLQAGAVTETLRQLLKHVGVCNGKMQEGSFRCDVNVNLEEVLSGEETLVKRRRSPRVEVKNLNSIRQVQQAAEYEVLRQAKEWESVVSDINYNPSHLAETRTWNPSIKQTELIRSKNAEQDYRFMPEPDLPPLVLNENVLDGMDLPSFLQARMPELPSDAVLRLQQDYGLSQYHSNVIANDPPAVAFLDHAIAQALEELSDANKREKKQVHALTTNLLSNDLFRMVNESASKELEDTEGTIQNSKVSAEQLGQVVVMIVQKQLSNTMAVKLLQILYNESQTGQPSLVPSQVAKDRGMRLISDPHELRTICNEAIDRNDEEREKYMKGGHLKQKMINYFVGQVMSATRGNADPELLRQVLEEELDARTLQHQQRDK